MRAVNPYMMIVPLVEDRDSQIITSVGEAFARYTGRTPEDLLGRPWWEFLHPEDQWMSKAKYKGLLDGVEVSNFRNRWMHVSGEAVWLSWESVTDSTTKQTISFARDITSSVQEEHSRNAWHHITSDLVGVASLQVPPEKRTFDWVNAAWSRQLGYDSEYFLRTPIAQLLHPEEAEDALFKHKRSAPNGESFLECRLQTKEGGFRTFEWMSIKDEGHIYTSGRDITEEKIHRKNISDLVESLREKNRVLSQFSSAAAHQLKSPPRSILALASFSLEDFKDADPEILESFTDICQEARSMCEIVEGLYSLSRVEGVRSMKTQPTSLTKILRSLQESVLRHDSGKFSYSQGDVILEANPILLREALWNLVDNGFKYNESSPKRVEVSWVILGAYKVQLSVSDNGIGLDMTMREKVFGMFERAHLESEGAGIGLALVDTIVRRHGGSVAIGDSSMGGLSFIFDIPISKQAGKE